MKTQNPNKPPATYRKWQGVQYILDDLSYYGLSRSDAIKRKKMWQDAGYSTRSVKKENGRYIIYRQYEP